MSYALIRNNIIESEGPLPASARRLDTNEWVMGLSDASLALQQACGYYAVADTARPADTATDTFDRSVTLVSGVPTVTWTQRPKTQSEIDDATKTSNHATILANLAQDSANMQALLDATNATINAGPAPYLKDIARNLRRVNRVLTNVFDGTS